MKRRISTTILSAAAGLVLFWYAGGSGAQHVLATGPDADVTEEGLHRVDPSIMAAAWARSDLDLSRYAKILFMPSGVQFREVDKQKYDVRSNASVTEFPIDDATKALLREAWGQAFYENLAEVKSYEFYEGVGPDVLVVQGFLIDVVSHVPPDVAGSSFSFVRDPWTVAVVLELRDSMSNEILARTIDRRQAEGLIDAATVWVRTEALIQRWAQLLCDRMEELSDLGRR